jgi:hypothetical protein
LAQRLCLKQQRTPRSGTPPHTSGKRVTYRRPRSSFEGVRSYGWRAQSPMPLPAALVDIGALGGDGRGTIADANGIAPKRTFCW